MIIRNENASSIPRRAFFINSRRLFPMDYWKSSFVYKSTPWVVSRCAFEKRCQQHVELLTHFLWRTYVYTYTHQHRHHYSKTQNGIYPVFKFKTQFNFEQKVLSKYYRIDIKMSEYGEGKYKRMQISSKLTSSEMFTKAIDCTAVSNPVMVVVVIVMIVPVHGLRRMLPVI